MTDRPVNGDIPDEEPIPEELRKEAKEDPTKDEDSANSAPESGDKLPE